MGRATVKRRGVQLRRCGDSVTSSPARDVLAGEEPLDIRIGQRTYAVAMRTPGHDVELVHGLLLAEGVLHGRDDVVKAEFCSPSKGPVGLGGVSNFQENTYNTLSVKLSESAEQRAASRQRAMVTSSACGSCGAQAAEAYLSTSVFPVLRGVPQVSADVLLGLTDVLSDHQRAFAKCGGTHAAMLVTPTGEVLVSREDVGRHNAVDKVVGWALLNGRVPARDVVLVVSSRLSYEIVAKASMAGIGVVVAVSAASSMAVEVAEARGLTIAGFSRKDRATVYTHPERVVVRDKVSNLAD